MSELVKGRRVYPNDQNELWLKPGDYGKHPRNGQWNARPPSEYVSMGSLEGHEVVEHEDGTITVSPSILISRNYMNDRVAVDST